jgi:hypothetical protein
MIFAALLKSFPAAGDAAAGTGTNGDPCALEGIVLDAASASPIEGTELTLQPTLIKTLSGPEGLFCFHRLAPGAYSILPLRIGHVAPVPVAVRVGEEGAAWATVWLHRAPIVERLVVRPRPRPSHATRGRALARGEILSLPASLDDPARALTSLPGVSAINDYKGVLRLGGGEPEDTLYVMDGVFIDNPYHFHWSRGAAAGFSAAAFDRIAVRTSGLGADVGDTISGVIELDPSERSAEGGFLEGTLGTLMASAASGGPTPGSGSWIASGRYSSLALYRSMYGAEGIEVPDFGDLIVRFQRPLRIGLRLVAGGLALANRLQTSDAVGGTGDDIRARAGGAYAGLDLATRPDLLLSTRLSWSGSTQRYDTGSGNDIDAGDQRLRLALRAEDASPNLGWKAGVDGALQEGAIAGAVSTTEGLPPLATRSRRLGAHAALRLGACSPWCSEIGARFDRDSRFGAAPLQPRLILEYAARAGWSTRLSAGRYAQFPRLAQEFLAGDEALAPTVADELGAGATLPLRDGFTVDVSVYERWMKDLTSEIVNRWPDLPERMGRFERGRARALELAVSRSEGWLQPRLSATLIDARQTREGITSPRSGDQPYLVSLSTTWLVSERWTLLGRFQTGAGARYSALEPAGDGGRTLGPLNGERLPAFSRLDLRASFERPAGPGRLRTYLEIANILGKKNIRGRDLTWDEATGRYDLRDQESMPLVPGFGLEFSWGGASPAAPPASASTAS